MMARPEAASEREVDSLRREHEKLALLSTGAAHRAGGGIR